MIGKILNERYKIVRKVGSGGMADVYEGLDLKDNGTVAIKILKQEYCNDPQYLRRLTREAQAMVSMQNEHIVSLYNMGNDGDYHYLVLEYVNGHTLRDYMDSVGCIEPRKAVDIICSVLDGLSHAHRSGLIHRDVKPQNIMMTADGGIKLTDFGIAKFAESTTKTYEGSEAMGSVYYISPEQAKGDPVDVQTDIYSVGVMLYEMLTGKPPFTGDNAVQVALKHINEDIKPLREVNGRFSPALSDVVERATAKDRKIRYDKADIMRADLKRALRYPHSRFARIKANEGTVKQTENAVKEKKHRLTRDNLPHVAIITAVVGVIAVFVVFLVISMSRIGDRNSKIPSFLGMSLEDASTLAENRGFRLENRGTEPSDEYSEGSICDQEPEPQTKAEPGSAVYVTISSGNQMREVPELLGKTVDEAKRALEAAELSLDKHIDYVSSSEPIGTVIGQSVNPGQTLMVGDTVSITVSSETSSETRKMPLLVGRDIDEALQILKDEGTTNFRIYVDSYDDPDIPYRDGEVTSQNPAEDTDIIYNIVTIELVVYKEDARQYKADFSENVELTEESNEVIITLVTPMGEIVMLHKEYGPGTYSIPFTGYYWEKGSYNCVIYVNDKVYTSFIKSFE